MLMSRFGNIGTDYIDPVVRDSMHYPLTSTKLQDNLAELDCEYNGIYFNQFQEMYMYLSCRRMLVRGGRGLGKTTIIAYRMLQMVYSLPRASFALLGSSVAQLYQKCVPATIEAMEMFGYVEGVDFVRGHAPKKLGFAEPMSTPRRWDNVLHFSNGSIFYLISTAVVGATNSMNLCGIIIDEARFQKYKVLASEVRPSIRSTPNPAWSLKNPMYLSEAWFSDGAVIARQREWEQEQKFVTPEINAELTSMVGTLKRAHQVDEKHGTNYELQFANNPAFCARLQELRCQSVMWLNCSSLMNAEILMPQGYYQRMKESMPELLFNIHILGHDVAVDKSMSFYSSFDPDIHGYKISDSDEINALYTKKSLQSVDSKHETDNCAFDRDIDPKLPLLISFDWNKNVNALVVAQKYKYEGIESLMVVKSMYVTNPDRIEKLCANFAAYFALHPTKEVIFYADATAKQGGPYASQVAEEYKFYRIVERELKAHGWNVKTIMLGSPMPHDVKYQFMNNVFAGKENLFPRINSHRNDYLMAALQAATIDYRMGRIHKNKSQEKKTSGEGLSENGEMGSNNYSDASDAFDTLVIGAIKFGSNTYTQSFFGSPNIPVFDIEIL